VIRFASWGLFTLATSAWGCAAVPSGFGMTPMPPGPLEPPKPELRAASGFGLAGDRKTTEVDITFGGPVNRWFGITAGGSYVALFDPNMEPIDLGQGFWPWLRPAVFLGPITLSAPLSGFALGGGGGGLWYGVAGLDLAIASPNAAVHAGARWDVAGVLGASEFSSRQLVAGGQWDWLFDDKRVGLSLEYIYGEQHGEGQVAPFGPQGSGRRYAIDESFYMVMLRASVAWRLDW
jgi:hypothetical protein